MYQPLPDQLLRHATLAEQQALTPTSIELHADRAPVVYVPAPGGQMVPVLRDHLPTTPPPAPVPAPRPLLDPQAQRLIGWGALAAGVGVGGSFLFGALAAATPAIGLIVLGLIVAKFGGRPSGGGDTHHVTVTNHNRWWGRSTTHTRL